VLRDKTIASGLLIGTYERPDGSIKDRQMSRDLPKDAVEGAPAV
jgi:hypothetical protein